jgi:protein-S-isoprenylcysteine O-methyltransferase Ste14
MGDSVKVVRTLMAAALFLVVIPLGSLYVGRVIDALIIPPSFQLPAILGVPIAFTGFVLSIASIWQLYSIGKGMPWGDVAADEQSSKLITVGLYRYTRNPMLLGTWVLLCGAGLALGSPSMAFLLSTLFVFLVSVWVKVKEEPEMVKRFGQEYVEYRARTPFMVPRAPRRV